MIRRSFQDLSKSAFIPLYGAWVSPHLEDGMPACSPNLVADINHLEGMQRSATSLVPGMRHLQQRLQRLVLHFLQRRRLRVDLITAFKVFKGLLDIDPNLFFLLHARRGLRGHLNKVLQGASHCRSRGPAFSVRVVKYCTKLPASVVTTPSGKGFKKWFWQNFPHIPHFPTPPPLSTCTSPLTVIISLLYRCGCFRPVVAYFLPL